MQHAATKCNNLQQAAAARAAERQNTAETHPRTPQESPAVHCNALQHTSTHYTTLQRTATHHTTL